MKYVKRIVDTEVWDSKYFVESMSPEDKYFYLYLLTNTHTTQLGIYKLPKKTIAFEMGYSVDTINVLIDRFENNYKMIKYSVETSEVAILNYLKHSIIKGGKPVLDCLKKEEASVTDKNLLNYIIENLVDDTSINATVKEYVSIDRDKSSEKEDYEKAFAVIYDIYPVKKGKTKAFQNYKLWVTTGKVVNGKRVKLTNAQIWQAVKNYVDERKKEGTDLQYYKHFDTLMGNQLLDYVEGI